MTSSTATQQAPTCATCPYFRSYNEPNGRGLCTIFSRMTKGCFPQTKACDDEIAYQESKGLAVVLPPIDTQEEKETVESWQLRSEMDLIDELLALPHQPVSQPEQPTEKAKSLNFSLTGFNQMVVINQKGNRYPIATDGAWCACPAHGECYHRKELKRRLENGLNLTPTLPPTQKTNRDCHVITPKQRQNLYEWEKEYYSDETINGYTKSDWGNLKCSATLQGYDFSMADSCEWVWLQKGNELEVFHTYKEAEAFLKEKSLERLLRF